MSRHVIALDPPSASSSAICKLCDGGREQLHFEVAVPGMMKVRDSEMVYLKVPFEPVHIVIS